MPAANYQEMVDYIRQAAIARGIDPETALEVARREALNVFDPSKPDLGGDDRSSFGPFQLHYGGRSAKMPNAGLGDEFTAKTGLRADDPSTWKQQVDFSLDYAAKNGWDPWMGAKAAGITGKMGIGTPRVSGPVEAAGGGAGSDRGAPQLYSPPTTVAPTTFPVTPTENPAQLVEKDSDNPWTSLSSGLASSVKPANATQMAGSGFGGAGGPSGTPEFESAQPALPGPVAVGLPGAASGQAVSQLADLFKVDPTRFGQAAALNLDAAGRPLRTRQYG